MKFDIISTWKDEAYRKSLSNEQINALPSHPAGELSDAELEGAFGGWNGGYYYSKRYEHGESYGLICEINIFSGSAVSNIALLGQVSQICAKG
ncbi:MAG TPA: mersacidin/lichenicidin family type 2 lantibiotic [Ktedonobacteraceae bacterium]|nr:mersacidin/lichenicidin family type 2 lantibiotic [Ktedonobacteraceae bacterium]